MKKRDANGYIDIEVENLIDWEEPNGEGCLVSDKITKEGYKVGYMYREKPDEGVPDSGWRFLVLFILESVILNLKLITEISRYLL